MAEGPSELMRDLPQDVASVLADVVRAAWRRRLAALGRYFSSHVYIKR
jgi:hypothetical protein